MPTEVTAVLGTPRTEAREVQHPRSHAEEARRPRPTPGKSGSDSYYLIARYDDQAGSYLDELAEIILGWSDLLVFAGMPVERMRELGQWITARDGTAGARQTALELVRRGGFGAPHPPETLRIQKASPLELHILLPSAIGTIAVALTFINAIHKQALQIRSRQLDTKLEDIDRDLEIARRRLELSRVRRRLQLDRKAGPEADSIEIRSVNDDDDRSRPTLDDPGQRHDEEPGHDDPEQ